MLFKVKLNYFLDFLLLANTAGFLALTGAVVLTASAGAGVATGAGVAAGVVLTGAAGPGAAAADSAVPLLSARVCKSRYS